MLNREVYNKGMALLMAAYPDYQGFADAKKSTATIETYWQMLNDFHDADFQKIITWHIKTKKWFPKISELREELIHLKAIRDTMTATQEWERLMKAAEAGRAPEVGVVTQRAMIAVSGGWEAFQRMDYESLKYAFPRFEKAFNEEAGRLIDLVRVQECLPAPAGKGPEMIGDAVRRLIGEVNHEASK